MAPPRRPRPQVTGGMGSLPPAPNPIEVAPGVVRGTAAPAEVTQPIDAGVVEEQLARAAANERALKPLAFATAAAVTEAANAAPAAPPVSATEAVIVGARRIRQVKRSNATAVDEPAEPAVSAGRQPTITDLSAGAVDRPRDAEPWQPAASNTDTPSRGIPRGTSDPGKQITGGFSGITDAQYFPLDGSELRELINALMDDLHARMEDDLRFTMAICYPRVRARVEIIVEGYAEDQGFTIPRVMVPHEKTPVDIARQFGDEIAFALISERVEMTAEGESVSPPNATRLELGLPVPHKQAVETPTGRMMVDLPNQ